MAFLPKKPGEGQTEEELMGQNPMVGGGAQMFASGASPVGKGTGGMSSFTNLQSYLNANPTDQGSANIIKGSMNKTLGDTRTGMADAYSHAKESVDPFQTSGKMDASKLGQVTWHDPNYKPTAATPPAIGGYFNPYGQPMRTANQTVWGSQGEYKGPQYGLRMMDPRNKDVQGILKGYNAKEFKPSGYNYDFSNDFNALSDSAGDQEKFRQYRDSVYQKSTPSGFTKGMSALQRQFDTNNTALDDARKEAIQEMAGIKTQRDTDKAAYQSYEAPIKEKFTKDQDAYKSQLNNLLGAANSGLTYYNNQAFSGDPDVVMAQDEQRQQNLDKYGAYKKALEQLLSGSY